ncbi:MAG: Eco57I restriction-modification methylase domain-containing protein [Candidatus Hodarchaeales archaeon]
MCPIIPRVSFAFELANLLCNSGLGTISGSREVMTKKRSDILLVVQGIKVLLEGTMEKEGAKEKLESRCPESIINGTCEISVGIIHPRSLTEEHLTTTREEIRESLKRGQLTVKTWKMSETGHSIVHDWVNANLQQVIDLIESSIASLASEDMLVNTIDRLSGTLDECIDDLKELLKNDNLPLTTLAAQLAGLLEISKPVKPIEVIQVMKMAYLLLIDAIIFYNVIQPKVEGVKSVDSNVDEAGTVLSGLVNSLTDAMQKDYWLVFEMSKEILDRLPPRSFVEESLRKIILIATSISSSRALLRHDLMGRVYHRLLLEKLGKRHAAYYTSIPAAALLARMMTGFPNPAWRHVDWSDPRQASTLQVVDFACGSGTLLSALSKAIENKLVTTKGSIDPGDLSTFYHHLVTDTFHGFDVQLLAVHMATLTLALHDPGIGYPMGGFHSLQLGKGKQGSVEFLKNPSVAPVKVLTRKIADLARIEVNDSEIAMLDLSNTEFDIVIMNPPFTRTSGDNLMFGHLPKEEQRTLTKELSKMLKALGLAGIGKAGLGAIFCFLADKFLKRGGRYGCILPKTALLGPSWQKVRNLWSNEFKVNHWGNTSGDYHVEAIILSMEPGDPCFSENTDLSECIVVTRKLLEEELQERKKYLRGTLITILTWKPRNEFESFMVTSQLTALVERARINGNRDYLTDSAATHHIIRIGNEEVGKAYSIDSSCLARHSLTWGVLFPLSNPILNRITFKFITTGEFSFNDLGHDLTIQVHTTSLDNIGEIGHDRATREFKKVNKCILGSIPAFIGREMDLRVIHAVPNSRIIPKNPSSTTSNIIKTAGNVLVAESLWWRTSSVLAIYLDEKVLSNVWWSINFHPREGSDGKVISSEDASKIQLLWFNTTPGILCYLAHRRETRDAWIGIKKGILKKLPVMDVSSLNKSQTSDLINLFDRLKDEQFPLYPEQYANDRDLRRKLDYEFFKIVDPVNGKKNGLSVALESLYDFVRKEGLFQR